MKKRFSVLTLCAILSSSTSEASTLILMSSVYSRWIATCQVMIFWLGVWGMTLHFRTQFRTQSWPRKPRQEFWLYLMSHLAAGPASGDVEAVTGPKFLKACIDGWNEGEGDQHARIESVRTQLTPELAVTDRNSSNNDIAPGRVVPAQLERSRSSIASNGVAKQIRDLEDE